MGNDERALDAFGNLSAERGEGQAAEAAFQQVLKLDPRDLTALSNLGILHAKQGNLPSAISLLQSAFSANQDIAGLAMNLARVAVHGRRRGGRSRHSGGGTGLRSRP